METEVYQAQEAHQRPQRQEEMGLNGVLTHWLLNAAFSLSATVISTVMAGHILLLFLSDTAESFLRKKAKRNELCSNQSGLKCSQQEGRELLRVD